MAIDKPRGKARSSQGINVMMLYVEEENGEIVNGHVASEIRKYARSVWVHIAKTCGAPAKWGDAGVKISQAYREHMYSRFPFLQFCELDWKVDLIATDNYPSWYSWFAKKLKTDTKTEQDEVVLTIAGADDVPLKRARDSSSEPLPKRTKVTEEIGMDVVAKGELPSAQPSQDMGFQFQVCA
jgi:hypothetical protein